MVTIKEGEVDIGTRLFITVSWRLSDILPGANASAEEAEESLEDGAKTVNNVIHTFRLEPSAFDKKSYLTYLKVRVPNKEALYHSLKNFIDRDI
jgi:Translationally controlled tumour protein